MATATVSQAVATLQQEIKALQAAHDELKAAHDIDVRNLDVSWVIMCSECLPSSPGTLPLRARALSWRTCNLPRLGRTVPLHVRQSHAFWCF